MEPMPPALKMWILSHWTAREVPIPKLLMFGNANTITEALSVQVNIRDKAGNLDSGAAKFNGRNIYLCMCPQAHLTSCFSAELENHRGGVRGQ